MKFFFQLITSIVFFLILTNAISCGKDAPPSPLYQTQSSKIQKEIQKRSQKDAEEKK